ncbi:CASP-like protein 1F1 [Lycium ferocissimum]|uniref:CASP-like protein 1F1 n=1 Tax=Lycium ferocissimum TaxID=112874 RepID=UPI002814F840|nr:CASP-like protein 1F1 [Lycium ferocissimum]
MNNLGVKAKENPPITSQKYYTMCAQILLRILATAFTLTATCIILNSKETVDVFTIQMDARYSYSPALKFFVFANIIGCAFSVFSLFLASIFGRKGLHPNKYFYLFVHDMIMMALLLAGCAAATTIGYVGKYGESHSGWMPICDSVAKFCHKIIASLAFSYFGVIFYLCLAIISANQSRKIQV